MGLVIRLLDSLFVKRICFFLLKLKRIIHKIVTYERISLFAIMAKYLKEGMKSFANNEERKFLFWTDHVRGDGHYKLEHCNQKDAGT